MSADRKKVLLADSDDRSRQIIEPSLENGGYDVTTVTGTLDALTALYKESFDLVMSAVALADGDGFELLAQCKLDPAMAGVPFVMLAGSEPDEQRAAAAGAAAVISKPVRVRTLVDVVGGLLGTGSAAAAAEPSPPPELPLDAVFTVEYRSFVANLGNLPGSANAVIRMFDGRRTLRQAIEESEVGDADARAMIPTLIAAEVLVPQPQYADAVQRWLAGGGPAAAPAPVVDPEQERLEAEARAAEEAARAAAEAAARAADEARRKADEARKRAEEEKRRREAEERRRAEMELGAIEAEAARLESERAVELERAREEADRVKREAEARAAALEADARRKAAELQAREQQLAERRRGITDRLAVLTASGSLPAAHGEAVDAHRESELRAMGREPIAATLAFSPAGAATVGLAAASGHTAAPDPVATAAAPAPAAPATAAAPVAHAGLDDAFFGDSQFLAKQGGEATDDLFAEPAREGVPPIVWAIGGLLLVGLVVVLLSSGKEPTPRETPPPVAEVVAPGSGDGSEVAEPPGPTPEELAALALAEATTAAEASGDAKAEAVRGLATTIAETTEAPAPTPAPTPVARTDRPRDAAPTRQPEPDRPAPATDAEQALTQCANLSSAGDYAATIAACQDAVRLNPRNSDAYTYLGKANYELGNVDAAINYLEQAVRLNARNRTALLALGAAKQEAGDVSGARQAYETYLEISPDSARAAEVRSILESL